MSDGGKGSAPRPIQNLAQFASNWDKIFKKDKCQGCDKELTKEPHVCKDSKQAK